MRRFIVSLSLIFALGVGLWGCGGGSGGTSADPLGTDTLTFNATTTSVNSSQTVVLTATVQNASGKNVAGRDVTFAFVTNASGAKLSKSVQSTNSAGEATIVYTAGAAGGSDTIRAAISNGYSGDVVITVTQTSGAKVSLAADSTTLSAGQSTILSATVTNGSGNPVSHQTVNFSFVTNNGGSSLTPLGGGVTDIGGRAVAVYTAGSTSPSDTVDDVVQATVVGASSAAVIITRTAQSATSKTIVLSGAPTTTLAAGQSNVLTATVYDQSGAVVSGETVTFSFAPGGNISSATLTTLSGKTDAAGQAVAVYKAGNNTPNVGVQDVVQATIAGSASAIIMTRTAASVTPLMGYQIVLSASVQSAVAGQSSVIKAAVTDSSGNPVIGQTVTFGLLINNSGAGLNRLNSGVTDVTGHAVAIYTAGGNNSTVAVQDTIWAGIAVSGVTESVDALIITRTAAGATPPAGYQVAAAASLQSLAAGQSTVITATVTDSSGNPAIGQTVSFAWIVRNSGAVLNTLNGGVTDVAGHAVAVYTAGANNSTIAVQDTIGVTATGCATALIMTRTAAGATPPAGYQLSVSASVQSVAASGSSVITATVTDSSGNPAIGQTVLFAWIVNNSGAVLNTLNGGVTDVAGHAVAVYTAGSTDSNDAIQDTVQASVVGSADAIVITRTAAGAVAPSGNTITVNAAPVSLNAGASSVVIANVLNASGKPVSGVTVIFGFVIDNSGATMTVVNNVTDINGTAIAVYTAGSDNSGISVQDAISASISGSAGAVIITRLSGAGTGNRLQSLTEDPETTAGGPLQTTSSNCILTATVTTDNGTTPVANEPVTFEIITGFGGSLQPILGGSSAWLQVVATDHNGKAQVLFTGPGGLVAGETVVEAFITGTTNGGSAARIIYW